MIGVVPQVFTNATGTIQIPTNPTDGDTITIGDGVATPIVYTFKSIPSADNDVQIGGSSAVSRTNLRNRINDDFNIQALSISVRLELRNNYFGTIGNFTLSEPTAVNNTVIGLAGGPARQQI